MTEPYGGLPPFVAGSATSKAAAVSMSEEAVAMREKVLALIRSRGRGGTIDDEIEVALAMLHQTASARRRELELLGAVVKTKYTRTTRHKRPAAVYLVRELIVADDLPPEEQTQTEPAMPNTPIPEPPKHSVAAVGGRILIDGGRSARGFSRIGALLRCAQLFANAERPRLLLGRQLVQDGATPENVKRFWYGWERGNADEVVAAFESAGYDLLSEEDDDVAHHSGNPDAKRVALTRGSLIHCGIAHWYAAIGAAQGGVLVSADVAADLGGPGHFGGLERVQPPGMEPCVVVTDPSAFLAPEDAMRAWCIRHPEGEEWLQLCTNAVRGYARRWQEDAQKWRVLAVECSHETVLGTLDCPGHPEHGDPLPYSARLDLEFSMGAGPTLKIFSTDHKSIGRVTNKAASYYSMHGQFTGHRVIGFETWGEKFGDAVLNLVETSGEVFARPVLEPSPGLTVSFKRRLLRLEHYRAKLELETLQGKLPIDEWPAAMNELSCYHRYGKCGSWELCKWGGA